MIVSVDTVLNEMAAQGMIPAMSGLSPPKAADLVHAEAQFLVRRAALRAITGGRNLLLDISMAFLCGPVAGSMGRIWQCLAGPAGGSGPGWGVRGCRG
jgi:hypothetical protein